MAIKKNKVFVVSLPRTGTTSVCVYFLSKGLKVAHTAFSEEVISQTDVLADTPAFADYEKLKLKFPTAQFIYLTRPMDQWCVSVRKLLRSMKKKLNNDVNAFEPDIVRCFSSAFPDFHKKPEYSDAYLRGCMENHRKNVLHCFSRDKSQLLVADITDNKFLHSVAEFIPDIDVEEGEVFPHVNIGRRITYWESVKHRNKVASK